MSEKEILDKIEKSAAQEKIPANEMPSRFFISIMGYLLSDSLPLI